MNESFKPPPFSFNVCDILMINLPPHGRDYYLGIEKRENNLTSPFSHQ